MTAAVSDRLSGPLTGAQVTVGGQTMNLAELEDEAFLGRTLTAIAQDHGRPVGTGVPRIGSGAGRKRSRVVARDRPRIGHGPGPA